MSAKNELVKSGVNVESAEIVYSPSGLIKMEEGNYQKVSDLIERLEELDDVQHVYSNIE
jgi:transcriptional/translational regulatory protein YebC/TACO1